MINTRRLDKILNKDFNKFNKTARNTKICESNYLKDFNKVSNDYSDEIINKLDLITYRRIHTYDMKKEFYGYITKQFYYSPVRKELSKYLQHGNTTIMKHCRNVAYFSFSCAKMLEKRFHIHFDYEDLIIGAYLHDLFMYDWHEKNASHRLHGFSHPKTASKNAQNMCNIDKKKQAIIESHMWPLTITKLPKSREAFLVCLFDKYAAILETFKIKF